MDRIDLHVQVPRLNDHERNHLMSAKTSSSKNSDCMRDRVTRARQRQLDRAGKTNAALGQSEILSLCRLSARDEDYLKQAMQQLKLSTRAFFRILRMARTIADLDDAADIQKQHLLEAIAFRFPR